MWRILLYSRFETCFGPSAKGAEIRYQKTSLIQILATTCSTRILKKRERCGLFKMDGPVLVRAVPLKQRPVVRHHLGVPACRVNFVPAVVP